MTVVELIIDEVSVKKLVITGQIFSYFKWYLDWSLDNLLVSLGILFHLFIAIGSLSVHWSNCNGHEVQLTCFPLATDKTISFPAKLHIFLLGNMI